MRHFLFQLEIFLTLCATSSFETISESNNENKFNSLTNWTIHSCKNIRDDYIGLLKQKLYYIE